jgi:protein ImuB
MNPRRWMVLALPHWLHESSPGGGSAEAPAQDVVAMWCAAFSPDVFVLSSGVAIDGQSVARYWGGWAPLWGRVMQAWVQQWSVPLLRGHGATVWQALARLQQGLPHTSPVDALALEGLPGVAAHLPMWQSLGLETWGQLRALPRGAVARRWGKGVLSTLDQAYGEARHCLAPIVVPAQFNAQMACAQPVNTVAGLAGLMQALLHEAVAWLYARGQRALALVWTLHLDVPHTQAVQGRLSQQVFAVASAQASSDRGLWWRLVHEHMTRWELSAPVHAVSLRWAQTQLPSEEARGLWDGPKGQSLEAWLDRVKARWGGEHVGLASWRADHVPERMQAWSTDLPKGKQEGASQARGLYPPWLLREPLRLWVKADKPWYQGPLRLVLGPQRLDAMPWSATWSDAAPQAVRRDYFVAHSAHAGWLWIYRERAHAEHTHAQWFLQGVYG